jgi:hypothetical protein
MANEAVCIETPKIIKRYTVADGTGIAKGTILALSSDPNTAAASSAADVFAGIAIEEKVISDGITEIAAAIDGVWDIKCNAGTGITLGGIVSLSGANLIKQATAGELLTGAAFGKILETASASEVCRVRLGLV